MTTLNHKALIIERTKRRLVELLDRRRRRRAGDEPRPVRALALARALHIGLASSADIRKRKVRLLIHDLRDDGVPIASDLRGYWMAETPADHARYQAFLRRMGLAHLALARADAEQATDQVAGQPYLFPVTGTHI